jgi:hypothetical protein
MTALNPFRPRALIGRVGTIEHPTPNEAMIATMALAANALSLGLPCALTLRALRNLIDQAIAADDENTARIADEIMAALFATEASTDAHS